MNGKLKYFLDTIKFEHTLFALPFAYLGLVLAEKGFPTLKTFLLVTGCMVGLRTVGMVANRLIDFRFDVENPRTVDWPLSKAKISKIFLIVSLIPMSLLYFVCAAFLNSLCLLLSVIPFVMVLTYPLFKRFSWVTHLYLGGILGVAPMGGWIASSGAFSFEPLPLVVAVLFWVAGFDIIYSLQDEDFDRSKGLFSIPSKFGRTTSLNLSRLFHGITLLSLVYLGWFNQLGFFYWIGLFAGFLLIVQQQVQAREINLAVIPKIFFVPNVYFSVFVFLGTLLDFTLRN